MKRFICSRNYSCVPNCAGIVGFPPFSLFLNLRYQNSIPGDILSSEFLACVCGWCRQVKCGLGILPSNGHCSSVYRHNIAMQWRFSDRELVFKVLSDVCLWWCLTQSCTALPGEPRGAGDQILFRVSQGYDFLDGTVSACIRKTSAKSRKSLYVFNITMYLYLIASYMHAHFEYFKCIDKNHQLEVVKEFTSVLNTRLWFLRRRKHFCQSPSSANGNI